MARKRYRAMRAATSSISDDFTLIKGIGPKIAARLYDIDILKYTQLAILTPDDLANRISNLSSKRITKENWSKQARKLAEKTSSLQVYTIKSTSKIQQHYATFTVELLLDEDNHVRRTRVTYVKNKIEENWAGWKEQRLADFIVRSAELHISLSESAVPKEPVLLHESTQLLETKTSLPLISKSLPRECLPNLKPKDSLSGVLRVSNLETLSLRSNMPQYIAYANEAFNVRILLDITGLKATLSTPLYCAVTIWAKKLGTRVRQIIGEQQSTISPVEKKTCIVESTIPSQGTYHLEATITVTPAFSTILSPQSTLRAWLEGGLFQVC